MNALRQYQLPLLWICLGLFLFRVLGQIETWLLAPSWLPSMDAWYSGLLPYPVLLPIQILLLMWMTLVAYDNTRRQGVFYVRRERTKRLLRRFSVVYFLIMLSRYLIQIIWWPETRWFGGGTIPIVFHWVLAAFMYLCSVGAPGIDEDQGRAYSSSMR